MFPRDLFVQPFAFKDMAAHNLHDYPADAVISTLKRRYAELAASDGLDRPSLFGPRRTGLPSVSLNTQFTAISRMGDEVTMGLTLDHVGRSSVRLALGCRQGTQQRVMAEQVLVATDLDTHRPIALPDDLRRAMVAFQQD